FLPTEFDLPPYGKKEIHFTAKLPPDAKGGYYGVLFFEKTEQNLKDVTGVNIITRVGTLLFFESQDKKKKSHVGNLTAKGNAGAGIFKNGGDIIMIPQGTYFVLDGEGVPVDRGEISKFYLPPLESAAFSIPLAKELTQGQYSLVITFDLGEGDSVVKELDVRKNSDDSMTILQERD
ncbi:MAG: hypothetical protein U1D99_04780, partial [Candidatus Omnitrophota bacterium]|nr:hypothetical protein [Candidatus Omnitrophota bacterium]